MKEARPPLRGVGGAAAHHRYRGQARRPELVIGVVTPSAECALGALSPRFLWLPQRTPTRWWVETTETDSPRFWRPEVQSQGAGGAWPLCGSGEGPSRLCQPPRLSVSLAALAVAASPVSSLVTGLPVCMAALPCVSCKDICHYI